MNIIVLMSLMSGVTAYADDIPIDSLGQEIKQTKRTEWLALPILFYTPETEFGGGAFAQCLFKGKKETDNPSTILPVFIYTQKNQIIGSFSGEFYCNNNSNHLTGGISYMKYPDKFYGIGPNTVDSSEEEYTSKSFELELGLKHLILTNIYAGLLYGFEHFNLSEIENGGLFDSGNIPGSKGGDLSKISLSLVYDTRDNIQFPLSGNRHQLTISIYDNVIGSDYDCTSLTADFREYFQLGELGVLGFQEYFSSASGDVPFKIMPRLGGSTMMRGYYEGRFLDKNMYSIQTEYRQPVWWKLGLAAFAGFGDVAHNFDDFNSDDIKYFYGFGIRYNISDEYQTNIRADFGFGKDTSGFYLAFGEAF
jgi:outer membrane protein assembly factor BamA